MPFSKFKFDDEGRWHGPVFDISTGLTFSSTAAMLRHYGLPEDFTSLPGENFAEAKERLARAAQPSGSID